MSMEVLEALEDVETTIEVDLEEEDYIAVAKAADLSDTTPEQIVKSLVGATIKDQLTQIKQQRQQREAEMQKIAQSVEEGE